VEATRAQSRSYGPRWSPTERVQQSRHPAYTSQHQHLLPLLGAIEILAGPDVSLLSDAAWADATTREWAQGFRSLRNFLAHGGRDPTAAEYKLRMTRQIVRILLREAVAWRLTDPGRKSVTGGALVERVQSWSAASAARLAGLTAEYPSLAARPPSGPAAPREPRRRPRRRDISRIIT
jgi:hypothetical protein